MTSIVACAENMRELITRADREMYLTKERKRRADV